MFFMDYLRLVFALILTALSGLNSSAAFAQAQPFDDIVVFGASLDDSGNVFVIMSDPAKFGFNETDCNLGTPINVPPFRAMDDLFLVDGVYPIGGHTVTNGDTWVENLARGWALSGSTRPAFRDDDDEQNAKNFAVAGARALDFDCRFNLSDQLAEYLYRFSESSPNTLFIFDIGGNDLRDIMVGLVSPTEIETVLGNIADAIVILYGQGARNILIPNVPNFGQTPAVKILDQLEPSPLPPGVTFSQIANGLAQAYNGGLVELKLGLTGLLPGIDIRILDLYGLFDSFLDSDGFDKYGILITDAPCVTPDAPPYICSNPDEHLFWDGIHPTKVIHQIIAQKAAAKVLEP